MKNTLLEIGGFNIFYCFHDLLRRRQFGGDSQEKGIITKKQPVPSRTVSVFNLAFGKTNSAGNRCTKLQRQRGMIDLMLIGHQQIVVRG